MMYVNAIVFDHGDGANKNIVRLASSKLYANEKRAQEVCDNINVNHPALYDDTAHVVLMEIVE